MYSEQLIGKWVKRIHRRRHLVQTVINGELVARCGRHLTMDGWDVAPEGLPAVHDCRQCSSRVR